MDARGQFTVTVKKTTLLEKLIANRAAMATVYEEAMVGYRKAIAEWAYGLSEQTAAWAVDAACAKTPSLYCQLSEPENHLAEYDRLIGLFTDAEDETIEITTDQHAAFMQNKWAWMEHAKISMSAYTARASDL